MTKNPPIQFITPSKSGISTISMKWFFLVIWLGCCLSPLKAQLPDEFQKVELLTGLSNAVNFEFAPDGRIFILDRYGELLIYKPGPQTMVSAGSLPVFHDWEDGLIGIAFDPDFTINQHLYLHYSPASTSANRVSRFTMVDDQLNISSEVVLLDWDTQRNGCCHSAGDLAFDSQGNLYIATGDNTHHSLYSPFDESNSDLSAEKSSSNTNDLRGKILRITPQADGTYTIPSDNLFPGGAGGLPEIYVMGARNPYRIFVDRENTDWLFWGEVGPDANVAGVEGPEGLDEINLTKTAGNYGWPYFSGKNEPYLNTYADPQFYYDPTAPVNLSTWNTGATNLPPATPSWLEFFHKSYLAGPRYYFDPSLTDLQRLPIEFDDAFFYYDFNTSQVWVVKMDPIGNILSIEQMAPSVFPIETFGFIDMKIGPEGHLYILEYGAGCCPSDVATGKLIRIDYVGAVSNLPPVISMTADPNNGPIPLAVNFSSIGTFDPEGDPLTYAWDFQSDGIVDSNQKNPAYTYTSNGEFVAQLQVDDGNGGISTKDISIFAGNSAATFTFNSLPDGGLFSWGDDIEFDLEVVDKQDGSTSGGGIDCDDVLVVPSIAHLNHLHNQQIITGCQGTTTLDADYQISINTGGGNFSTEEVFFGADQYATGGDSYNNGVAINGTTDDVLYQTERFGNFSYNIPIQDQGLYDIRLHFAEIFHGVEEAGAAGDRVFNVNIEGVPVLTNFDILSEVAPATAIVKEFNQVAINDGQITIQFTSLSGNSKISAIEVTKSGGFDIYGEDDISHVLGVNYTDKGGLTASDQIQLYPMRHEAEFFDIENDIVVVPNSDNWGGSGATVRVNHNSYIAFFGRNLASITSIKYRTASGGTGGSIELRLDGVTGPLLSRTDIPSSGSWSNWLEHESPITDPGGKHDLYFVFKNNAGDLDLFELNYLEFGGAGISIDNSPPEVLEVLAPSSTSVQVEFSEVVTKGTAENIENYLIESAILISSLTIAPDNRTVILTTSKLNPYVTYNLSVSNVENLAGLPIIAGNYPFSISPSNGNNQLVPRLKVYPNPATSQVTLEVELITPEIIFVNIYDAMGKEFYFDEVSFEAGTNIINLDLKHLTDGLYYLKLTSRGTNLAGHKLVIKN